MSSSRSNENEGALIVFPMAQITWGGDNKWCTCFEFKCRVMKYVHYTNLYPMTDLENVNVLPLVIFSKGHLYVALIKLLNILV